jgi:RNA polymerase sigma factor (sigma-70 family)
MIDPDRNLILNIKNKNCEESIKKLIEKHSPLCYKILQKFYPSLSKAGYSKDDIFNERFYLIYKSVMTFNPLKKTKYSTWLGNYTRYHCLNMLNARKEQTISIEEENIKNTILKEAEEENVTENTKEFVSHILEEMSDKRIKQIYMMRYFEKDGRKRTWKQIAKKVGVSSQTVINIHNKAKKILKTKLKSKNTLDFV